MEVVRNFFRRGRDERRPSSHGEGEKGDGDHVQRPFRQAPIHGIFRIIWPGPVLCCQTSCRWLAVLRGRLCVGLFEVVDDPFVAVERRSATAVACNRLHHGIGVVLDGLHSLDGPRFG